MDLFQAISIYFVWHPSDAKSVYPLVKYSYKMLSKNIDKPFSRSVNIPVFFRTSYDNEIPKSIDIKSEKTLVFLFISKEIAADDNWILYIKSIIDKTNIHCVPIAIDKEVLALSGELGNLNFIREYSYNKEFYNENLFISLAHEIYRYLLNDLCDEEKLGKDNSVKLFISHAKDGEKGIKLANALKKYIDNTNMRKFFDATDIAPGYRFDSEIENNIKDSTIISINSDIYSSRYWCQREILCAKEFERPIIAVDLLDEFEDRRFPHSSNIPCIHVHINDEVELKDILRILNAALLETIRLNYSKILLNKYKELGLVDKDTVILSRPPEAFDIRYIVETEETKTDFNKKFLYPEPPLYNDEIEYLNKIGLSFITPLTIDLINLKDEKIGISISEPSDDELIYDGINKDLLIQLSQELSRHLLARNAELIYGGDLRPGGFTEFIFDEAMSLNTRMHIDSIRINNYIAWPIYNADNEELKVWKCKYRNIANMINTQLPEDVVSLMPRGNFDDFLSASNPENCYIWSRSLTNMRYESINNSDFRISAGGKHLNYKGRMPGVLEEIIIAILCKKPVYLLGGFGGVTSSVCEMIRTGDIPEKISKVWQVENQEGYKELLDIYKETEKWNDFNFEEINKLISLDNLNNGLNKEDNLKLFQSQFVDEIIYLILKGLENII